MVSHEFENLQRKARQFLYSSFTDLTYRDIQTYTVIKDEIDVILIYGYENKIKKNVLHWATNHPSLVITDAQEFKEEVLIPLVPTIWESEFLLAGFYQSKTKIGFLKNKDSL